MLLTTTGPGSFVAACALMEARTSYVPLVNIVSQVPRDVIGTNRGFLHELPTQSQVLASFAKWHALARGIDEVPDLIAEAFRQATSAPPGPVVLEIPVDVLEGETDLPAPGSLEVAPVPLPAPDPALLAEAAGLLDSAERPVLWAGGGVLRAGAAAAFVALAERLGAPAATTYMGKGAIPADHPLAVGSACDEGAFQELLRTADVVLAVGSELGAETTGPVVADVRGPPDPGRCARRASGRDVRGPRHPRRRARGARGARAARLATRVGRRRPACAPCTSASRRASRRRAARPSCTCSPIFATRSAATTSWSVT